MSNMERKLMWAVSGVCLLTIMILIVYLITIINVKEEPVIVLIIPEKTTPVYFEVIAPTPEEAAVEKIETQQDSRLECTVPWDYEYTTEEVEMLGDLIFAEVEEYLDDEDSEFVAKATGSVVLHRVAATGYYPNSVYEVIHQNEGTKAQQYATTTLQKIGNTDTPEVVYEWAEEILRDGPIGPANLVFQDNRAHGKVWFQYGKIYYCTTNNL